MTGVTRDLYRDGPPDGEPVLLSDKFVTPGDAIQWLDPSNFQPGQGAPLQLDDLAEPGAEMLGDEGYDGDEDHPTS